jgi:signal transduction histidine kinase
MALDTSPLESQRVEAARAAADAPAAPASGGFAARWTAACLALLDELRSDEDDAPTLARSAGKLVRHGVLLIPGAQCVISVVPPEQPGAFTALAGAGEWAASVVGGEWPLEGTLNGRAMLGGQPVETTHAQAESSTPEVLAAGGIDSGRVVPLRLRTTPLDRQLAMGAIGFWRTGNEPFSDEDRALIDTYAELATVLLHRSELLEAATRTTQRLESAVDVAVETSSSLVPTSVIRRLLERSLEAVEADRASLCRIEGTTMTVLDVVDSQRPADKVGDRHEQPWHPAVIRAVQERRPVAVAALGDDEISPEWREGLEGVERSLFAPLLAEGEVIALLTLMRRRDRPFTDADLTTVQLIGNIAALSLRNAERYAEAERAHERSLRALAAMARHVDDTYELRDFFGKLTTSVAELVRARGAAFFALEPDGAIALVERAHNVGADLSLRATRLHPARGSAAWRVTFDNEVFRSLDPDATAAWLPGLQAHSMMAVPWRAGERVLGSLIAFNALDSRGFSDEDVWVLRIASLAAGLVVEHRMTSEREVELARETRERAHEISVVQDAAQALSAALDINEVYKQIVQAAANVVTPPATAARRATLLRLEGDQARIIAEYDEAGRRTEMAEYRLDEHPALRRVVDEGAMVVVDLSAGNVAPRTAQQMESMGVLSSAFAPVRVDEKVVAILRVSARDRPGFEPVHLERLSAIANVAALAIGNAERFASAQREAVRRAELENVKSDFLRLASHELRGPIGLLRGYLSMFEDGTVPAVSGQARETLPILLAKISQMSRMVDDMLETARLEEGRLQLNFEETDLRLLVERAVHTVRHLASPQHTIRTRVPSAPVRVSADTASVETILTNLLDNAIKYSPEGGLIDCVLTANADHASVGVHDRGLGIADTDLDRLFTKFGRILTPQNSHIGGTGLGLHLARQLAQMQGGTITVRSRPHEGSVFTLHLPLLVEKQAVETA